MGHVAKGGFFSSWNRDRTHRREAERMGIFPAIWIGNDGPLPWRLTREQRSLLDRRMLRLMWPHYIDTLTRPGASFWVQPGIIWKSRTKVRLLYFILPTQWRDQLPALRYALDLFVWGMRRLMGQVHSYDHARALRIVPGSLSVSKTDIRRCHRDIIRGLVLLEGCFPLSQLNPAMHHFVHYAQYTRTHGPLLNLWMMGFERYVYLNQTHFFTTKH